MKDVSRRTPGRLGSSTRKQELFRDLDKRRGHTRLSTRSSRAGGVAWLLLDCSGSMDGYKLTTAKQAVVKFAVSAIRQGYRVGVIAFGTNPWVAVEMTGDNRALASAMKSLEISGSTNMAGALALARTKLTINSTKSKAVVLVTDGAPDERSSALNEARRMKNVGIRIITIGTDDADLGFLKQISTHDSLARHVTPAQLASTIQSAAKMLPPRR